jgi:predicted dehydrogenase
MSLRAAIAGAGFIGAVHAHAVRAAGGRVVAALASTPGRSEAAARRLGAERPASGIEELVTAGDVDVVHVCTPNHLHDEIADAALAAGKHVVCEKPLAVDLERAERLAARAASLPERLAVVPFAYRYYPTVHEARRRIASGEAGAVHLIHGTYLQDWLLRAEDANWRVDPALGGESRAFADIGSHWCDLAEFVTGHRVARLSARTLTAVAERPGAGGGPAFSREDGRGAPLPVRTEDAAVVQFETDGGAIGAVVVSQVSAGRKNRLWLEVDAARGAVAFDQEDAETLWCGGRDETRLVRRDPGVLTGSAARLAVLPPGHPQGYQDCFDLLVADVVEAVRTGAAPDGLPTFADGARAARITDAVVRSAREQAWVDVPAARTAEVAG